MKALLLIIYTGLGSPTPDLEVEAFRSLTECSIAAHKHIDAGRFAQCSSGLPDFHWYPPLPPMRIYIRLWIKPWHADHGETFLFFRPSMVGCMPERDALRAMGHTANCRGSGARQLAGSAAD